jgi:hypothetical protein
VFDTRYKLTIFATFEKWAMTLSPDFGWGIAKSKLTVFADC